MSNHENILGKKIKEIRKKEGMSQEEFAFQIDVSRQTVYFWENGKAFPDSKKILTICEKFNIDPNELLFNNHQKENCVECASDFAEENVSTKDDLDNVQRHNKKNKLKLWLLIAIVIGLAIILTLIIVGIFTIDNPDNDNLDKLYSSQWNMTPELIFYALSGLIILALIFLIIYKSKIVRGDKQNGKNKKDNKD